MNLGAFITNADWVRELEAEGYVLEHDLQTTINYLSRTYSERIRVQMKEAGLDEVRQVLRKAGLKKD
jgi:hypothetical protein